MAKEFPILKTERLLLRQFTDNDLEPVFAGLSHPDVIKHYGVSYDSMEATKEQMSWFKELEETGTGIWWAICSLDNQTFYGGGGFNNLSKEHKRTEVGFWLLPKHWRQGIMREAMPLICNYAFEHLDIHRIEGFVEHDNIACKKGIEKLGFELEGTMKDYEIKDGQFISLDIYAMINGIS